MRKQSLNRKPSKSSRLIEDKALLKYGTDICPLEPSLIVLAAESDMSSKVFNKKRSDFIRDFDNYGKAEDWIEAAREYAFCPEHVELAESAIHLIKTAIACNELGLNSDSINTLRIYMSIEKLHDAKQILQAKINERN